MISWFLGKNALATFLGFSPHDQDLVVRALDLLIHRPGSKVQINLTDPETYAITELKVIYSPVGPRGQTLLVTALVTALVAGSEIWSSA